MCLTFDVDAETTYDARRDAGLSALSSGRFGITRGLPRILGLLDRHGIPATFYVPGMTARRHPAAIRAVTAAGHEIGHHGHRHLMPARVSVVEQRDEVAAGLEALADVLGVTPAGYRAPGWELTPETLGLLVEHGFGYDSSCMGDDRPYVERHGDAQILELPVDWSLDDWPFFGNGPAGGTLAAVEVWIGTWRAEVASAVADRRPVTLTMHPEIVGRGYRLAALEAFVRELRQDGRVRFASHAQLAAESASVPVAVSR